MRRRDFVTALAAASVATAHTPPAAGANDWPTLRSYGLVPTMVPGPATIKDGLISKELHNALEKSKGTTIDQCAAGCPNVITVGSQCKSMSYADGAGNCVAFLNRIKGCAEDENAIVRMGVRSSRLMPDTLGRLDQTCDHVAWGVDVTKRVNSPRVKIFFDFHHVQIMDGDISRNVQQNIQWIAHFHTDTQEINYGFVAKTSIAHEYRPTPCRDPLESLNQALGIMDV